MIPKNDDVLNILEVKKLREHKLLNEKMIFKLSNTGYKKYAEMMFNCGSYLEFSLKENIKSKELKKNLSSANFCKFRFCSICNWRRTLKIHKRLFKAIGELEEERKLGYILLTLTVKNPKVEDLKEVAKQMNAGFTRMSQRKDFRKVVIGYFKAFEILGSSTPSDEMNPHFHILLIVSESYFKSRNYIKQSKWTEMWKNALRIDYTPVVDVRRVRSKNEKMTPLQSVVAEVAKYSLKQTDLISKDDEYFKSIIEQTKGMRFYSTGGMLKKKFSLKNENDVEDVKLEETKENEWIEICKELYSWNYNNKQYELKEIYKVSNKSKRK